MASQAQPLRLVTVPLSSIPEDSPCCEAAGERNYRRGYYDGQRYALLALGGFLSQAVYHEVAVWLEKRVRPWVRRGGQPGASISEFPPRNPLYGVKRLAAPRAHGWLRTRYEVLRRDNYRCCLCGTAASDGPDVRLEVDHIHPHSRGGSNDPSNLHTLCWDCNHGKGVQPL